MIVGPVSEWSVRWVSTSENLAKILGFLSIRRTQ
jgi:hypothetical protein